MISHVDQVFPEKAKLAVLHSFYLSDPSWLTQPVVKLGSGVTHPNFGFRGFAGMSTVGNEATFDI